MGMLSKEQSEIVKLVYTRFIDSEEEIWTEIDDNLEMTGFMSSQELVNECIIKFEQCSGGIFRCNQAHDQSKCIAPIILEGVGYILALYDKTSYLPPKNKYVLEYFLVLCELKMIYLSVGSGAV
jgi:hypothetical protein